MRSSQYGALAAELEITKAVAYLKMKVGDDADKAVCAYYSVFVTMVHKT